MATQPSSQDQFITHFLSLVAHALRSPLNTINGYLDLTLEGIVGELNEQQREFIQRARASSEHLYTLLEDLLLVSRADVGQLRLNRAMHSLERLVGEAIDELDLTARDAGVTIEAKLPADLPDLWIDAVRIQQVLRNLLSNALHFTPSGGHVTINARLLPAQRDREQPMVEISVRDSGSGIPSTYHERVFERFFQVPRPEGGRTSGQGLGLTVVRMIVEQHGGQVWIKSEPGAGCIVVFTLDTFSRRPV